MGKWIRCQDGFHLERTYEELVEADEGCGGHITNDYTIFCGLCTQWVIANSHTKKGAIEDAKQFGYKKTKAHGWLCPHCYKAYKNRHKDNNASSSSVG